MIADDDIVILAAKRTAIGSLVGELSSLTAPQLAAISHRAALEAADLDPDAIEEVITGCVLQAGIGQAPARQAALAAGLPLSTPATTINKMCGSGMKAVMLAHDLIKAETASIIMAGGMESMSNAPYLLEKVRAGLRLGHQTLQDHLFVDGLEDAYEKGKLMGYFAENTARQYQLSRELQDEYASRSLNLALEAQAKGAFKEEIAPASIQLKEGVKIIDKDEGPDPAKGPKISKLRPVFQKDGTVTAANASSISDGAASLIVCKGSEANRRGIKPLARIIAHASHAQEPQWFTTAPVEAIRKVLKKANWRLQDVDLFEINEAFAVVALMTMHLLNLPLEKINIHGGACILGHPIGASGARIIVTLLHALQLEDKKRGIAALCIGGGEATALAVERII